MDPASVGPLLLCAHHLKTHRYTDTHRHPETHTEKHTHTWTVFSIGRTLYHQYYGSFNWELTFPILCIDSSSYRHTGQLSQDKFDLWMPCDTSPQAGIPCQYPSMESGCIHYSLLQSVSTAFLRTLTYSEDKCYHSCLSLKSKIQGRGHGSDVPRSCCPCSSWGSYSKGLLLLCLGLNKF